MWSLDCATRSVDCSSTHTPKICKPYLYESCDELWGVVAVGTCNHTDRISTPFLPCVCAGVPSDCVCLGKTRCSICTSGVSDSCASSTCVASSHCVAHTLYRNIHTDTCGNTERNKSTLIDLLGLLFPNFRNSSNGQYLLNYTYQRNKLQACLKSPILDSHFNWMSPCHRSPHSSEF